MKETIMTINHHWRMRYDGQQYMPERWKEESEWKGKLVAAKWVSQQKYFKNPESVVKYIAATEMAEQGEITVQDFIDQYMNKLEELTKMVRGEF